MRRRHDLVVIGMGSCGIVAAEFAARLGLRVAVVERSRIGGDCLWTGCVPSKALIASARAADTIRHADRYGLKAAEPEIDLAQVWARIRTVQQSIARTDDDPERIAALGIDVMFGSAEVTSPTTVLVDGVRSIETRFVLVSTGSHPAVPRIVGLEACGYLTSENLFEVTDPPRSIVVVGGGPIGTELSQAFARLGIVTTLVQRADRLLPIEEPVLVERLERRLQRDGVRLLLGAEPVSARRLAGRVHLATVGAHELTVEADAVLVAAGRVANTGGLGLERLGIEVGEQGIVTDPTGKTAVPTVYAAGDVTGGYRFTHAAAHDGVKAVRNMFFPGHDPSEPPIPWCIFTDPELAHVGLTVAEAERRHGRDVEVWRRDLSGDDRPRADAATDGSIVLVTAKGRLVGAQLLSPRAGELVQELVMAIRSGMRLSELGGIVHAYPTYATPIARLAADAAFDRARRYRWLMRPGRVLRSSRTTST